MATELAAPTVNGNYAGQDLGDPYGGSSYPQAGTGSTTGAGNIDAFGSQAMTMPAPNEDLEPSKDEVGWSFVKQYYKSLNSHPEKLHLFYNKKSQFVSGVEAEKVNIAVGRVPIAERFKELDFQDCKVLLTNVDIQSSDTNILLQVIGAMSNKGEPHTKFIQTFILTRQSVGYYVLNDMLRFMPDEGDDVDVVDGPTESQEEKTTPQKAQEATIQTNHKSDVDTEASKDATGQLPEGLSAANLGMSEPVNEAAIKEKVAVAEDAPVAAVAPSKEPENLEDKDSVAAEAPTNDESKSTSSPPTKAEQVTKAEAPVEPAPTPAAPKPSVPKTWANLVASSQQNKTAPSAATPTPAAAPSSSTSQTRAAPTAPSASDSEQTEAPPAATTNNAQTASGWQTAGNEHAKRQSRPQSMSGDRPNTSAYVKYVTEKVEEKDLRAALEVYGELSYFDISRQKNCAFADFATVAGYNAAIAANPHRVNGESIVVEERRPRANAYNGGQGYSSNRMGSNRGRGGFDARGGGPSGRGGYQRDGGRGNYSQGRGRGGNVTPRGRGSGQSTS